MEGRVLPALLCLVVAGEAAWQANQFRLRVESRLHPSHEAPRPAPAGPALGRFPPAVDSRPTVIREPPAAAGIGPGPVAAGVRPGPIDPGRVQPSPGLADPQTPGQTGNPEQGLQGLLQTNPGMHVLNERIVRDVFDGRSNEVVCTFCLLQVFSVVYQLGNGQVRGEIEAALNSTEPDTLGEALFNAASKSNETLSGTLKGYYQKDQLKSCDKVQEQAERRGNKLNHVRCEGIRQFVADVGQEVDFERQPETTRAINQAVEQATGGRIQNLFAGLDASTKLVFASALVFADKWRARMAVSDGAFRTPTGSINTETIYMSEYLPLLDGSQDGVVGVSLPYEHDGIRMFLFTTADERADIRQKLQRAHYAELTARSAPTRRDRTYTRVELPSFQLQSKKHAYGDLAQTMGMAEMFRGGLGADDQLKVDQLVHKAVIKTDRDGTEAAGAAGIALVPLSSKPTPFEATFDRPFICSLVHMESGVPFFTTFVADPSKK